MAKNRSIQEVLPETYQAQGLQRLWRAHSDAVNKALVARWRPVGQMDTLLKTDLFDEAVSDGLDFVNTHHFSSSFYHQPFNRKYVTRSTGFLLDTVRFV
jgi:hypothetical protein